MRLQPGEDPNIDEINRLVHMAKQIDDVNNSLDGLMALQDKFMPLIYKLCGRWSTYFNDSDHRLIPFETLVDEATSWFREYTLWKYIEDGEATYNNFIRSHLDARIRYIYEQELRYAKHNIMPDPNKYDTDDNTDTMDNVIYKYGRLSGSYYNETEEIAIDNEHKELTSGLCEYILMMLDDRRYFEQRDAEIYKGCEIYGKSHEAMASELGITRPRVSQIVDRVRERIRVLAYSNKTIKKGVMIWKGKI